MATKKNYLGKPNYNNRFVDNNLMINSDTMFEFDESSLWNSNHHHQITSTEFKKSIPSSRILTKKSNRRDDNGDRVDHGNTAKSLPVNIPDWSKILREDHRIIRNVDYVIDDEDDYDDEDEDFENDHHDSGRNGRIRIPPHEFLARRTQISSFSVHEGIGRTLKGRDLSRVRDAIWQKTGFED
ncbi:hypothetical protein MKW98_003133 [Papaver atlanticum]|uniref:Senescence regulator n=1 Tax=Papaver atlanticum TaxID=357466 RepID=A0AAD4TEW0_9MAGN|nr:hypothetical protein MKW98_003133 [Papaver atlanticum]